MKNVGRLDRSLRFFLGLFMLSLLFLIDSNWRYIGLVGLFPLFNAISGMCFVYRLFGINTCRVNGR
jgi:Protein of unknown function (DUF2892)